MTCGASEGMTENRSALFFIFTATTFSTWKVSQGRGFRLNPTWILLYLATMVNGIVESYHIILGENKQKCKRLYCLRVLGPFLTNNSYGCIPPLTLEFVFSISLLLGTALPVTQGSPSKTLSFIFLVG